MTKKKIDVEKEIKRIKQQTIEGKQILEKRYKERVKKLLNREEKINA